MGRNNTQQNRRKIDSESPIRIVAYQYWAMFRKPQPLLVSEKVRQYTSNLHGTTPPICIAVLSWLLSFEDREALQYASHFVLQYASHLYSAVRPPFVQQNFWKNTGGWGHRNVSEIFSRSLGNARFESPVESVGISYYRLLTPCHTRLRRPPRGPFSYQGVSTRGVRHSPDYASTFFF